MQYRTRRNFRVQSQQLSRRPGTVIYNVPGVQQLSPHIVISKNIGETQNGFVILTSSYNKGPYLRDWARSIIFQQYRPLNVVFVDDSSTDQSVNMARILGQEFQKHGIGSMIIRNRVRAYCSSSYRAAYHLGRKFGKYFGVVDADDMLAGGAVEFVQHLYQQFPEVAYIYTQFAECDSSMKFIKKGISKAPLPPDDLLSLGERKGHAFSHWRTFSDQIPEAETLWQKGLRCAVDKYMGYRLEELGVGMFVDKICYHYRGHTKNSIVSTEQTKKNWVKIVQDARHRRIKHNTASKPILIYTP